MTICGAFAAVAGHGVPQTSVGVYADSRATVGRARIVDGTPKLFPLAPRCCATAAGRVNAFLETIKERVSESGSSSSGKSAMSLWQIAGGLFRSILEMRALLNERERLVVLVAGSLSNDRPALAEAIFEGPYDTCLRFYRPGPGEVVSRTAGVEVATRVMADAVRVSVSQDCDMSYLSSVLRDLIGAGMKGIGGALSYGICLDTFEFVYPAIALDGCLYRLGAQLHPQEKTEAIALKYRRGTYECLLREDQVYPKFTGGHPTASFTASETMCFGTPTLFAGVEPEWATDPAHPVPGVLWVITHGAQGMGTDIASQQSSALHEREILAVHHRRAGSALPPPPAPDATTAPVADDEMVMDFSALSGDLSPRERPDEWDWKAHPV